jgi:tetraacyldisaccharide 4'-kinase
MQPCIGCSSAKMTSQLRNFIESSWYCQRSVQWWLKPFAYIFAAATGLRRLLYRAGILPQPHLPVPVIVAGNINVGGTGKTPFVAWLVKELLAAGEQPGIVSRGYGGQQSRTPALVTEADAVRFGDEPVLLAKTTGCPVCVCVDRVAAVRRLAREGVTVVVADDGLQHYRMRREAEIVVVDGERGFGNGWLIPAGPLRESASRALGADAIVVNGSSETISGCEFELIPQGVVELNGMQRRELSDFAGQTVLAVAGIGNPARFRAMLSAQGIDVVAADVPDHGKANLAALRKRHPMPMLMTEKDAVKYTDSELDDVWYVPVVAEFSAGDSERLLRIATDVCKRARVAPVVDTDAN